LQLVLLN